MIKSWLMRLFKRDSEKKLYEEIKLLKRDSEKKLYEEIKLLGEERVLLKPFLIAMALGIVFMLGIVWGRENWIGAASIALTIAASALATGAAVAFLFGIPRSRQREASKDGAPLSQTSEYEVNTNLEQVSDWLTKIILSIGLIQLTKIPTAFDSLATHLSQAFGQPAVHPGLVGSLLVYFGLVGFLFGYLWTRMHLAPVLSREERAVLQKPEFLEGMIHSFLYQPRGYERAIKLGEAFLRAVSDANYRVWLYLACAYGQQYSSLKEERAISTAQLEAVKKQALAACERTLYLNPSEYEALIALWDKGASPQEDDLVVFGEDKDFQDLFSKYGWKPKP